MTLPSLEEKQLHQEVADTTEREEVESVRSDLNTLEQLIDLLVRHLFTKLGEDVSQLSSTNVTVPFLIEDLETTDELLCSPGTRTRSTKLLSGRTGGEIRAPGVPAGLKPSARFKIVKKLL